jgi:type I restriction enzyme R subunit
VLDATLHDLVNDTNVQVTATNNTPEGFGEIFPSLFQKALIDRMDRNQDLVIKFLDNQPLAADLVKIYTTLAQAQAKVAYQAHCPIGDLLHRGEDAHLEFKSTMRTDATTGEINKNLETAVIKSVAAFANSADGGTLLIGVADDGTLHGVAGDYKSLHKDGKDDPDVFALYLQQTLINALGEAATSGTIVQRHTVDGQDVYRVHVPPSPFPVDAKVTIVDKKGQHQKKVEFYIRIGNGTRAVADDAERGKIILRRWGGAAIPGSTVE